MIRLKSYAEAVALRGKIPELAIERMKQFEGDDGLYDPEIHGHIVVLEAGDEIDWLLDDVFEYVEVFQENVGLVWEMVIQIDDDKTIAVIIPDTPNLDERLRVFLCVGTGQGPDL